MAVVDRFDIVQRAVEERRQVVLLAAGGERANDLIEMEVAEKQRVPVCPSDPFRSCSNRMLSNARWQFSPRHH